jgi:hypothetical protein
MTNGICDKCHSTAVYRGSCTEGEGLTAGSYNLRVDVMTGQTPVPFWVDTYICRACGYVELHVANRGDLRALENSSEWEYIRPDVPAQRGG